MLAPQLKPTIDIKMLYFIRKGGIYIHVKVPWYHQSCSIIICILMESCSIFQWNLEHTRKAVTQLHSYVMWYITFKPQQLPLI